MKSLLAAASLIALLTVPAQAQQAFTTDDMLRIEDLSDPTFSADGERIVYVVNAPGDGDTTQSDLWQVGWDGSGAQAIHATLERDESSPEFSADGRVLAFVRSGGEGEASQLWVSESGGNPRKVSDLPGGVNSFSLSPDGLSAVIESEVGVNVGQDPDVPPPIVIDRLKVKEDWRGWLDDRRRQLFRLDIASGEAVQITSGDFDHWAPAWSPDGQWIAFTSRRCDEPDMQPCSDVYVIPPAGGEPRRISTSDRADADPDSESGGAQWSPDSRSLLWVQGGDPQYIWYTPSQIVTADLATGTNRNLAHIDRWFFNPRWSADGRSVLSLIEQDRTMWLARIDPASEQIAYLTSGNRFAYGYAEAEDGRIAVLDGDANTPTQLRALERRGSRVLSPQNGWIAGRTLAQTQDVAWTVDGVAIHGLLLLPPGHQPGQRHPLVVRLHGGPVYQFSHEFQADWQVFAAQGYAVLGVNPRGSSGRGADFARAQMANWGGPDVRDVMGGIDHAISMGVADPEAIGVGGWSYGGLLTNYMIASDPRIRAAVSGAGMSNYFGGYGVDHYVSEYTLELGAPWEETERWMRLSYPFFEVERISTPTLFLCGENDWNVPCTGSQQMYTAMRSLGVPTRLVVYPGQHHGLVVPSYLRDRMDRQVAWYDWYLRGLGQAPLGE